MVNAEKIIKVLNKKHSIYKADYAIVVGSGLMGSVPDLEDVKIVAYDKLGMPKSKVKGHSGKFIFGRYADKNVVLVSRQHYYESGDMFKVRLPFEIVAGLGVKKVILLTSSGGINKTFRVGDIMLIKDHINLTGNNPLIAIDPLEFTPMADAYNKEIFNRMVEIADEHDINVRQGIHIQLSGPSYETLAEIDVARNMGADTVSMSTAYDCIISNYLKMKVCGIASVVNVFSDKEAEELNHEEVLENAKKACSKIKTILCNLIKE